MVLKFYKLLICVLMTQIRHATPLPPSTYANVELCMEVCASVGVWGEDEQWNDDSLKVLREVLVSGHGGGS